MVVVVSESSNHIEKGDILYMYFDILIIFASLSCPLSHFLSPFLSRVTLLLCVGLRGIPCSTGNVLQSLRATPQPLC